VEISSLIELFRIHTQDEEFPGNGDSSDSLFQTSEIVEYFDFAQKEFARRTEILKDSRTFAYTSFAINIDEPWVEIPSKIISIKKASLLDSNVRLKIINHRELDQGFLVDDYGLDWEGNWETKTGTPQLVITDMDTGAIRLFPIPVNEDTLQLQVTRYPDADITSTSDDLEIPEQYHRKLLHHVLYMAYSKQDADAFDPQKAEKEFLKFEQSIEDAKVEFGKRYNKTGVVKYGGL